MLAREQRARRRRLLYFLWTILILLVTSEAFWFAHHRSFLINQVAISGNQSVITAEIKSVANKVLAGDYWSIFPRRHSWWYPKSELIATLKRTFPPLDQVEIARQGFTALTITVTERQGQYLWCQPGEKECQLLDHDGFAFAPAPQFGGQPFLEVVSSTTLPVATFRQAISLVTTLNQALEQSVLAPSVITKVVVEPDGALHFSTKTFYLIANPSQEVELVGATLRSALLAPEFIAEIKSAGGAAALAYLDLRFPDKVFYKFAP